MADWEIEEQKWKQISYAPNLSIKRVLINHQTSTLLYIKLKLACHRITILLNGLELLKRLKITVIFVPISVKDEMVSAEHMTAKMGFSKYVVLFK